MASADSDDDDHKSLKEEMLTCQLCFEVYKTPKLLSCQHSFCEHCLERWVQTNHGRLVCPCCRQHVSLPVGGVKGLPTNRVISHFFDYIDRSKRKAAESQGVPCETCSTKYADRRCIQCSQYLCGRCSSVHSKAKKTRTHILMCIGEFEEKTLTNPTIEQPETYCEKHRDKAIEVFCETCEMCVCVKCALTEHPNPTHQYVSVDKAAVKAKGDFSEFVLELDRDRIRTSDARNTVEHELLQLEENLKTGMEKIDKHVDKIIQNARKVQKKTRESYQKAFDMKTIVLKSQIQNLEIREKSLSNTREFAEMQISYASSAQFLRLKDEMKQLIQNILTTEANTDLEENSCLDFKVDASPAVDEFGQVQTSSAVGQMSELDESNTGILRVGEEYTFNIWTKDSKGCNTAAAPYVDAELIAVDDVGDVPVFHSKVLPVENSTSNAGLCHVKVNFSTEGTYQLKVSVCGQPLSGTPRSMRVHSAGSFTESTNETRPEEDTTKNEDEMENEKENAEVAEIAKEVNSSEKAEEEKRNEEIEKKSKEESIYNSEVRRDHQWSPINTKGKRQYDREFLLQFQFEAICVKKPEGLPKIANVILDSVKQPTRYNKKRLAPGGMGGGKMEFYLGGGSTKNKQGGYMQTARGAPRRQNQKQVRKIISRASLGTDIKLRTVENAWKPLQKKWSEGKTDFDPEKAKTEEIYKKVTGILNKLTPQKFQTLTQQVLDLPIDTEDRLKGVIDLVFEKAISEPGFSVAYANLCRCIMAMKVPTGDGKGYVNFRKLLLMKCKKEFEKDIYKDDEMEAKKKAMEEAETKETKDKRKKEYDSYETKMRRRSFGNIMFLGELFKLKMQREPIMHDCVVKLLKAHDHESLECLCSLLSTIGKDLEHEKAKPRVDQYFAQMDRIFKSKKYSVRVRFMLQDVIELRGNNWVPRRDEQLLGCFHK
ncbi:uncharacterized protein [Ptychodera flava]|uniref:uncharacterized protein isoform X2 n=1 Tax=Ptychodera flava TaxID=63121 RepID=UPI00396A19C9